MFKTLRLFIKPHILNTHQYLKLPRRTFLSQAYYCREVWDNRLHSPIFQKVNLDILYHDLDQGFQRTRRISPVDVDIFVNSVKNHNFVDELLDLVHKLRLSADTGKTLESTGHAVIRALLNFDKIKELLTVLDDRLNYGVFVDDYAANILMDHFWKTKNYVAGCIVAAQLMLQEDFGHPVATNFALLHCYKYLTEGGEWPQRIKPEEPEDEVKVRVQYIRNPYDDEHFDLEDPKKIVGKTLIMATKDCQDPVKFSLNILGLALFGKEELIKEKLKNNNVQLVKEIIELIPDEIAIKQELEPKISEDVLSILQKQVEESVVLSSEKDIASQCETYNEWEDARLHALDVQKQRLNKAQRLAEIERLQQSLKEKEEKLWFFENEENIELQIEEGEAELIPVKTTKTKGKAQDETYIPPEVKARRT